jgi:hypothetical protein
VNLTLSYEVADDMVNRYKCIPFFLNLTSGTQLKHAQFSAIAIGNLARKEVSPLLPLFCSPLVGLLCCGD